MKLKHVYEFVTRAHRAAIREPSNGKHIAIGTYKDKILVLPTLYQGFIVDPKDWIFDTEKLLNGRPLSNGERLITNDGAYERATVTDELKSYHGGVVAKLSSPKYPEVWVNTKFLAPFEKTAQYEVAGAAAIVRVYEDNELVGVVCPIVLKK